MPHRATAGLLLLPRHDVGNSLAAEGANLGAGSILRLDQFRSGAAHPGLAPISPDTQAVAV
jgi:hypothetical protein